jgi:hypothetical protein
MVPLLWLRFSLEHAMHIWIIKERQRDNLKERLCHTGNKRSNLRRRKIERGKTQGRERKRRLPIKGKASRVIQ